MRNLLSNILINILLILQTKEDKVIMAMLWVTRILAGKKTYKQVPERLKPQVKEILIDADLEFLIEED